VVESPHIGDRATPHYLMLEALVENVNLRPGGIFRRKRRTVG
jgi:hypothetical protein